MSSLKFRQDINGLRAWAVVAVILFHFGIPGLAGGFVGVDIFFVISGYLMTGIIIGGLERPTGLSLAAFYLARARRILPALLAVGATLLAAGWFCLSASEYDRLATEVLYASTFLSNIQLARSVGYFDAGAHEKLLLHSWSLSTEWQFYLLLPVLLLLIWKLRPGRHSLLLTMTAGLLLSLLTCLYLTGTRPASAFYLLPSRAWEMLAGGLLYLNPRPLRASWQRTAEWAGFGLILASILLLDGSLPWPGWRALLPVCGAVLVLLAARQNSWLTAHPVAQWLGNCSYSLYLWHWPLVVALNYLQWHQPLAIAAALLLTLLLGWLSWRLIEQPARRGLTGLSVRRESLLLLASLLLVLLPTQWIRKQDGIPGRLPAAVEAILAAATDRNPQREQCAPSRQNPFPECRYGSGQPGVIVLGDSHAAATVRALEQALPGDGLQVLDWTRSGCSTVAGIREQGDPEDGCADFLQRALQRSHELPAGIPLLVINRLPMLLHGPNEPDRTSEVAVPRNYLTHPYDSRSDAYLQEMREGFISTLCQFAQTRPVYALYPTPELRLDVPLTMGRSLLLGHPQRVAISVEDYRQRSAASRAALDEAARRCNIHLLDPQPILCGPQQCFGDLNGHPLYFDDDHLSQFGARQLVPLLREVSGRP